MICKACFLGGISLFCLYFFHFVTNPELPSENHPILFYSNQSNDDLKIVFKKVIEQTKRSLFLQIYGCTDSHLIHEIKKASLRNVFIKLFYDPSASGPLKNKLPFAYPLSCQGLMHKKILISDHSCVFIGSANFTPTSLRMHDNLIVGLHQKELASFIETSTENHFLFSIGHQTAEFWHLPDFQKKALERILKAIDESSSSIYLALFTFTHPQIVKALIGAKKRGVEIHIAIDFYSAQGASKKTIERLREEKIFPLISQGGKLMHHKWAIIDQSTLFLGSANWTKSAFQNNEDCIFILQKLTTEQKKYFIRIWKEIHRNSLP